MNDRRTLKESLDAARAQFTPEVMVRYDRLVEALRTAGVGDAALKVGDACPAFMLANAEGGLVASSELLEKGPLVLSFYRGSWCPFCVTELEALEGAMPQIGALGATLAAVTAEACGGALLTKRNKKFTFEILCDLENGLALNFGLVFRLNEGVRNAYVRANIDFPALYGNDSWFLPIPATYVIGQDGIIRHAYVNPEFRERLDPSEIIAVLKTLRTDA